MKIPACRSQVRVLRMGSETNSWTSNCLVSRTECQLTVTCDICSWQLVCCLLPVTCPARLTVLGAVTVQHVLVGVYIVHCTLSQHCRASPPK